MTATVVPSPRRQRRPRAVTIREVASRAAVSVATVSRVLSGKGPVQATTWQRVLDAADALRYVPHSGARSLSTSRTNTIGVLLPDLYGEFFSEVIRGVDLAARRRGYHLLVSGSHSDRTEVSAVLTALRGRVDGILVMSPSLQTSSLRGDLPAAGVPVVLLNCVAAGTDGICVDNYGGARAMMRHLGGLDHRLIAFIKGPQNNVDAHQRLRGYRMAMRAFSKSRLGKLELDGDFSEEAGYAAGRGLLSFQPRPTAVFAANDAMAIGALRAVQEAGIKVPEEMALAGFDDIPIARYLTPSLTTVNVAIAELGRRALEMLLTTMENPNDDEPQRETIPTTLVVRESCGAGLKKKEATPIRQIAINSNRRSRP